MNAAPRLAAFALLTVLGCGGRDGCGREPPPPSPKLADATPAPRHEDLKLVAPASDASEAAYRHGGWRLPRGGIAADGRGLVFDAYLTSKRSHHVFLLDTQPLLRELGGGASFGRWLFGEPGILIDSSGSSESSRTLVRAAGEPQLLRVVRRAGVFSPDGVYLACDPGTCIVETETGRPLPRSLSDAKITMWDVLLWAPTSKRLYRVADRNTITGGFAEVYGVETKTVEARISGGGAGAWSSSGDWLAFEETTGGLFLWDAVHRRELPRHDLPFDVSHVAFAPRRNVVAAASAKGHVAVVNVEAKTSVFATPPHDREVTALAWSPDGQRVASAARGTLRVHEAATGAQAATWTLPECRPTATDWSTTVEAIVVTCVDGVHVVKLGKPDVVTVVPVATNGAVDALIHDALGHVDGTARVLNMVRYATTTGERLTLDEAEQRTGRTWRRPRMLADLLTP